MDECGSTNFQKNLTYIVHPGFPSKKYSTGGGTCKYTLSKGSPDICMLRLDFVDGSITDPDSKGSCPSYFTSNPVTGPAIPPICGTNDGLHLYLDAGAYDDDDTTFSVVVGETNLDWKIRVSQIECSSSSLPWAGCLQYHMGVEGQSYSFNYQYASSKEHLQEQHYQICVRHELDHCSIGWIASTQEVDSFKISIKEPSSSTYYGRAGILCYADFIMIPRGSNGGRGLCDCGSPSGSTGNTMPTCDTYCGGSLNCNNNADYAKRSEIISKQIPFMMGVNLNPAEPATSDNRGFNMIYRQYPCNTLNLGP